jgi:hypothetical protein
VSLAEDPRFFEQEVFVEAGEAIEVGGAHTRACDDGRVLHTPIWSNAPISAAYPSGTDSPADANDELRDELLTPRARNPRYHPNRK